MGVPHQALQIPGPDANKARFVALPIASNSLNPGRLFKATTAPERESDSAQALGSHAVGSRYVESAYAETIVITVTY